MADAERCATCSAGIKKTLPLKVFLESPFLFPLSYKLPEKSVISDGSAVVVPFGNRLTIGWAFSEQFPLLNNYFVQGKSGFSKELKSVSGTIDNAPCLSETFSRFILTTARYFLIPAGSLFQLALPFKKKGFKNLYLFQNGQLLPVTRLNQQKFLEKETWHSFFFKENLNLSPLSIKINSSDSFRQEYVCQKDRINFYQQLYYQLQAEKKSLLLLAPDNSSASYYQTNLSNCLLYDSSVSRQQFFLKLNETGSAIICGNLLALFLPLENIGAIVIDRPPSSYYSLFNLQKIFLPEAARLRAELFKIPLYYGNHLPPLKAFFFKQAELPQDQAETTINLFPLNKNSTRNFRSLTDLISSNYQPHSKFLILMPNRKTEGELFCLQCQKFFRCPHCRHFLFHNGRTNICHNCGYQDEQQLLCPRCNSSVSSLPAFSASNFEIFLKNEAELNELKTVNLYKHKQLPDLNLLQEHNLILASPQAISLSWSKLNINQLIYVQPESFFHFNNFNSAEIIFYHLQELISLLGISSEAEKQKIECSIFSHFIFHYSIKYQNDRQKFFEKEEKYRKWLQLPPFGIHLQLIAEERDLRCLGATTRKIYAQLEKEHQVKLIYLLKTNRKKNYQAAIELQIKREDYLHCQLPWENIKSIRIIAL